MRTNKVKKILAVFAGITALLVMILAVHIYIVTRPKAPDVNTLSMARFDLGQQVSQADADKMTAWLYTQKGIDHVMSNVENRKLVFTYFPVKSDADKILDNLRSTFNIKAERYKPTPEEIKSGCPVATTSKTYKAFTFFKKLF